MVFFFLKIENKSVIKNGVEVDYTIQWLYIIIDKNIFYK